MLKITLAVGHRFNVSHNGEPVRLKDLKLSDESICQFDGMLHSLRDLPRGSKIAFLTYERPGGVSRVIFFEHSSLGDIPVYLENFPIDLLGYLAQIESAVLHHVVIDANNP